MEEDSKRDEAMPKDRPTKQPGPASAWLWPNGDALGEQIGGLSGLQEAFSKRLTWNFPVPDSVKNISSLYAPTPAVSALIAQLSSTLSRARDFPDEDEPPTSYSDALRTPGDYFAAHEDVVESMDDLHRVISRLTKKANEVPLVWRGAQDADWALHSSLFRALMTVKGVTPPNERPTGLQPFPTEDDMVIAETEILRVARETWRYDGLSALETFARLQHHGAPTRLLDVTRNPYIAAWFAVEASDEHDRRDARLFALATAPVPKKGATTTATSISLDAAGSLRDPFWHALGDNRLRQMSDWGTGSRRRLWVPPEYDPRIVAQNAAFVIDGVPMISSRVQRYLRSTNTEYWSNADLLASSSIFAKMYSTRARPKYNAANLAPTFSFRITGTAKPEIRTMLERWFGYSRATIYPDISGLSQHITGSLSELVKEKLETN